MDDGEGGTKHAIASLRLFLLLEFESSLPPFPSPCVISTPGVREANNPYADDCQKPRFGVFGPGTVPAVLVVMGFRVGLLCAALVLCSTRMANAGSSSSAPFALEIDNQVGWVQGRHSGGVDAGSTVRFRYHVLTAGLSLQGATILLGSMGAASVVAGLSIPVEFLRFDALAEESTPMLP